MAIASRFVERPSKCEIWKEEIERRKEAEKHEHTRSERAGELFKGQRIPSGRNLKGSKKLPIEIPQKISKKWNFRETYN